MSSRWTTRGALSVRTEPGPGLGLGSVTVSETDLLSGSTGSVGTHRDRGLGTLLTGPSVFGRDPSTLRLHRPGPFDMRLVVVRCTGPGHSVAPPPRGPGTPRPARVRRGGLGSIRPLSEMFGQSTEGSRGGVSTDHRSWGLGLDSRLRNGARTGRVPVGSTVAVVEVGGGTVGRRVRRE